MTMPRAATSASAGDGCDARNGLNRNHAVLGASSGLRGHSPLGHVRGAGRC